MNPHDCDRAMLALSAAGLLEPPDERRVREHARLCAACAAELDSLGALAAGLAALASPAPPPDLVARTQVSIAADRDRRHAHLLAVAAAACAGTLAVALGLLLQPYVGPVIWVAGAVIPSLLGAGAASVLAARRRLERSVQ